MPRSPTSAIGRARCSGTRPIPRRRSGCSAGAPQVSFEDGLDRTIAWYMANRPWWEKQLWMREIPIITKTGKRELH